MTPADLPLQPKQGQLTLAAGPMRHPRTGMLGAFWLCWCGRILFLRTCDTAAGRRPERCKRCSIARTRIPLHHINQRAVLAPDPPRKAS